MVPVGSGKNAEAAAKPSYLDQKWMAHWCARTRCFAMVCCVDG